ncbi:tetratricopeptide repeat protein 5-like isoform X3 [Amblyomma americanum]
MADDQAESSKQRNENNGDSFCLKSLKEAVDELYTFRDNYYVKNPNASQKQRTEDVEEKLTKVLNELDAHGGVLEKTDRATFQMLKGKALNIREDYDPEAHEALSKAVKFNPKLAEAWNELGECYWKKGHITKARNCFEGVLKVTKDKVSLRNLSMVLRQVGETEEERLHNVLESVTKAKEALQLDIADGKSWSILGNAYLTVYFSGAQNVKSLQQALAAYARALEDPRMLCCSDLFHNRAVALQHEEDYQCALEQLERACSLEPHWAQPREKAQNLIAHLQRVSDAIAHKVFQAHCQPHSHPWRHFMQERHCLLKRLPSHVHDHMTTSGETADSALPSKQWHDGCSYGESRGLMSQPHLRRTSCRRSNCNTRSPWRNIA